QEGETVRAGELLARFDAAAPRAAVEQVDANIAAAQRTLAEAERNYARVQQLRQQGLITVREYDSARFDLDQAKQELARLAALRREAAARLNDASLYAPVSGVVLSRPVDPGQIVTPQTLIYEIAPLADVEVEAEVDEQFLSSIEPGMPADVIVAGRKDPLRARLYYIAPKVDPRTGGARVRLRFEERVSGLRSGLTADINLVIERRPEAITIARSAILGREESARVLVVRNGVVEARPIRYREWPSDRVIVDSGLREGEQVLIQPRIDLIGEHVRGVTDFDRLPPAARPRGSEARRAI
ncbi:MAG: efflux RND transporter periplasmic adaptor subunit, partial [Steroidobacteraceae bacterium]|nr:efflux RND transporter periplasmic adaptor subunit [Steroidobacteraceae bacterium]MDW8258940.1 efflux RND transporter periplasmic adaptor subunit [Gammaproteobacteria bacterium]